jgi:hypothetical protein
MVPRLRTKCLMPTSTRSPHFPSLDGDHSILETEPDIAPLRIPGFPWDRIAHSKPRCYVSGHLLISLLDRKLLEDLAGAIHKFITRGKPPTWSAERASLVECGIARFLGDPLIASGPESLRVAVEEPLALVSIMRYFERNGRTLYMNMATRSKDDRGTVFEEAVLLAMTKLLQNRRRLGDILDFHGPLPP